MVDFWNDGNVEVVFSDFELFLPRLDPLDERVKFVRQVAAKFYIDKRLSTQIGGLQQYSKVDHRTNVVRLGPRESHIDYYDLEVLLPDAWKRLRRSGSDRIREGVQPDPPVPRLLEERLPRRQDRRLLR
jgi:hypothetical protein